ncbi:MAG: SPASM domain-containing protein, partial [Desulfohalobiaceae bacterium]|nr:SPASM domain-containing protein [Desulfohalobiaceae bacterium]
PLFGGCTGFGCGAAFNFVSLLPDGEVHACRKFPSYLGNIFEQTFDDIYDSQQARAYRAGPAACRDCSIRPVCRGCPAVIQSLGLDVSKDRDPFCPLPSDRSR